MPTLNGSSINWNSASQLGHLPAVPISERGIRNLVEHFGQTTITISGWSSPFLERLGFRNQAVRHRDLLCTFNPRDFQTCKLLRMGSLGQFGLKEASSLRAGKRELFAEEFNQLVGIQTHEVICLFKVVDSDWKTMS